MTQNKLKLIVLLGLVSILLGMLAIIIVAHMIGELDLLPAVFGILFIFLGFYILVIGWKKKYFTEGGKPSGAKKFRKKVLFGGMIFASFILFYSLTAIYNGNSSGWFLLLMGGTSFIRPLLEILEKKKTTMATALAK